MKPLKIAAVVVLVICLIMAIVITIQPDKAHLEREIFIEAPDSVIFPYVSNYRKLSTWWPWPKMDAELKQSYEGVDGTLGSRVYWSGSKAGKGSMTVQELIHNKKVKSVMVIASEKQSAISEFTLESKDNGTAVHWTYDGVNDGLPGKAKWIVMGTLLNSQYDLGLKNLKKIIEDKQTTAPTN
ncbi:SRPBCC family protein [Chryseolinea sp. T2]|uniref:SRPBCC family protein n=1 Tax=Chryseolinea sp. T2 TaxID=3129255 RepID=UPI00307806E5